MSVAYQEKDPSKLFFSSAELDFKLTWVVGHTHTTQHSDDMCKVPFIPKWLINSSDFFSPTK